MLLAFPIAVFLPPCPKTMLRHTGPMLTFPTLIRGGGQESVLQGSEAYLSRLANVVKIRVEDKPTLSGGVICLLN